MDTRLLVYVAMAFAMLSLVVAISAHRRFSAARRALLLLQDTYDGKTILDAVSTYLERVDTIRGDLAHEARRIEEVFAILGRSARNLGVVRYDAFEDMGGKMSFSAALLDDHASGVVITSINARSESRVYAKVLLNGDSEHNLSDEERRAIQEALGRKQKVGRLLDRSATSSK
ncbi:MAG TPA: DUF4446 family protein [Actinomycetota bacterium]|nr:DUF4446 family protein [Actinomycetota bacterium]